MNRHTVKTLSSSRTLLALLGTLALAALATVTVRLVSANGGDKNSQTGAASEGATDEVSELESQVKRLKTQLAIERGRARTTNQLPQATAHADEEPVDDMVEDEASARPPTPEEEAAWLNARADFYDTHLRAELRDHAWASPLEAKIRELAIEGGRLTNVECRSTMCRLEFDYADRQARDSHLLRLSETLQELPRASYSYPGEPHRHDRAVIFMGRPEHPLPEFR